MEVEGEEVAVSEGGFVEEVDEFGVEGAEVFLGFGEFSAVKGAFVDPFGEFGHGPVVEDGGAAVVGAESFGSGAGFSHLLAVVEENGATGASVEDGGDGLADIGAVAAPVVGVGEADFVVVFGVAQGVVEDEHGHVSGMGVEVVGPGFFFVEFFEDFVGGGVVDGVESGGEEVEEHAGFVGGEGVCGGDAESVILVGFCEEEGVGVSGFGPGDGPLPEFGGDHVGHVGAEAIDAEGLPVGEDFVHFEPGVWDGVVGVLGVGEGAGEGGEVESVVEFGGFVPVVDGRVPVGGVVTGDPGMEEFGGVESVFFQCGV